MYIIIYMSYLCPHALYEPMYGRGACLCAGVNTLENGLWLFP